MTTEDGPARDRDVDRAWRDIVEHYGDRVEIEPDGPPPAPEPEPTAEYVVPQPPPVAPEPPEERFVPPPPPPLPYVEPKRRLAWAGLFGAPLVLLVFTIFGWGMPRLVAYTLVASFVAGFVYLVAVMPRGPRDPGDDGARV